MPLGTRQHSSNLPGLGAFCVGLALIVSAAVLNIAHDGMDPAELRELPALLGVFYQSAGKLGVTLALVGLGLAVIAFGALCNAGWLLPGWLGSDNSAEPQSSSDYSTGATAVARPGTGKVVLATRKYFGVAAAAVPGKPPRWAVEEPKTADEYESDPRTPK
jgi:hypothetical protein